MGITSFYFWIFLIIFILLFYAFQKNKYQWIILFIANFCFFFIVSGAETLLWLLYGIVISWLGGILIEKSKTDKTRRLVVISSILLLVIVLAKLKYVKLGITICNMLPCFKDNQLSYDISNIIAPIGISYYTLSVIGYLLEVYWKNISAEKNILKMATFVTYFPQMTSGPITRYGEMKPQLFSVHEFDHKKVYFGIQRILWGLFKKLVIADRSAIFVSKVYSDYDEYTGLWGVLAVLLFALQLYADFSGCMDIIMGVSECFDIVLPENFNSPFMSETVSEFWDRWHITMGKWFRDFLLYPLMKSDFNQRFRKFLKKKIGKTASKNITTYLCMSVIWITIGVWHGGSFKFIFASGILQGFYLIMGQVFSPFFSKINSFLSIKTDAYSWHLFRKIRTFICLCTSWAFVKADSFKDGVSFIKSIFASWNPYILFDDELYSIGLTWKDFNILYIGIIVMLIVAQKRESGCNIRQKIFEQNLLFQWGLMLLALFTIIIFGIYGPGYDAADFIYKNF